jgi:RNA polymerase sigma factor (TIGR02999 family)
MAESDPPTTGTIHLLRRASGGERQAIDALMERMHTTLFEIAELRLRGDPLGRAVDPASLITEVYLKLIGSEPIAWTDRVHFLAVAAKMMRHALLDLAKARDADKRGGGWHRVTLSGLEAVPDGSGMVDIQALERALKRLAELDERQARVVELRFFAGMTEEGVAEALGVSRRTVQIDWSHAKAWLHRELSRGAVPD